MKKEIKQLIGSTCSNVFLQSTKDICFDTDLLVINFKKNDLLLSLHSFSLARCFYKNKLIYTSTDHYLSNEGIGWVVGQKKISSKTFKAFKQSIVGRNVLGIILKPCGDIFLRFEDSIVLQLLIDYTHQEKKETHRLLIEKPSEGKDAFSHYVYEF